MENTEQKSTYNNLWSQIASPPATTHTQVQRPQIPAYSSFSSHHSRPHTNRRPQPQHNVVKSYSKEHLFLFFYAAAFSQNRNIISFSKLKKRV